MWSSKWYMFWSSLSNLKRDLIILNFNFIKLVVAVPVIIAFAFGYSHLVNIITENVTNLSENHHEFHHVWNPAEIGEITEIEFEEKTGDMLVFNLESFSDILKLESSKLTAYYRRFGTSQNNSPMVTYYLILDDHLVFVFQNELPKINWARPYIMIGGTISADYLNVEYKLMHPFAIFLRVVVFLGTLVILLVANLFLILFTTDACEWICKSRSNIKDECVAGHFKLFQEEEYCC